MKIRTCFVSNSSSSSFIIKLPNIPKNKNELKSMLDFESVFNDYPDYYYKATEKEIIDSLYEVIEHSVKEKQEILDSIKNFENDKIEYLIDYLGISLTDLVSKSLIDIIKHENIISFSYSDDHKFGSAMEHVICPNIFGKYFIKYENNH